MPRRSLFATAPHHSAQPGPGAGVRQRPGFALFVALFVLLVVATVSLEAALRARAERHVARNVVADLRARAAARSGVADAVVRLQALARRADAAAPRAGRSAWARPGRVASAVGTVALDQRARYRVELHDAGARLPLNRADGEELRRLLLALGSRFRAADVAAQSILDWRDEDGAHRPRGAEWDDYYRYLSPPVMPRNGPFASVAELRWVRGITDTILARLERHVTVIGVRRVNLNAAPEPVLRALPGMSEEAVGLVLERRAAGRPLRSLVDLEADLSPSARTVLQENFAALAARASFEPRTIEIVSTGWTDASPLRRTARALVRRTGGQIQVIRRIAR